MSKSHSHKKDTDKDIETDSKHHFKKVHLEDEDNNVSARDEKIEKKAKKKKKSAKEIKEKIETDLTAIYAESDGSIPDMHTFVKRKRKSFGTALVLLVSACVFLGAVAWFGFTVLQPKSEFREQDVILTISGGEEIVAGEEVTYRIRYRNAQNVSLDRAMLEVRYPEGFQFVTSTEPPVSGTNDKWELATIGPDASGYIDITGRLWGAVDSKHSFRLFLNYQPANFSSEFQRVAQATAHITKAPISIGFIGPSEARPGREVVYDVVVEVDTEKTESLRDARLVLSPESGFSVSVSEPQRSADGSWPLNIAEKEQNFKITGSFNAGGESAATSSLVFAVEAETDAGTLTLLETAHEVTLEPAELTTKLIVNGTTDSLRVQPGDVLNASITVENTGDSALTDVQAKLSFDGPSHNKQSIFDWNKIDDVFDGDIVGEQIADGLRRGIITWNKEYVSDFASLEPGERVIIDVRLPISTSEQADLSLFELFQGLVDLDVRYTKEDKTEILGANNVELLFNTDALLEVRSGVEDDVYKITWILTNHMHDLKNVELKADFFGDISFDASGISAPAGSVSYDDESQTFTWTIENMPTSVDVLALQFDVKLNKKNPSQTNISSRVRGKATDTTTGQELVIVGDEVLMQ